ncbi:MAG: hypothetical protein ACW980_20060, partial [Promethearchaeota archaeon]
FNSDGYFCEGEVDKNWHFSMESGKIMVTKLELLLIKKSNINLTEMGSSVDNFTEGYKIPLSQIKKAYSMKNRKIHVVIVETRDNHLFSITMADEKSFGKNKSIELSDAINAAILI